MPDQVFIAPGLSDKRQLGKYEVLSRLSTGGMSEIYLASQGGLAGFRKLVVLKTILPDISGEDDFVRMFLDEARITALFNHPNIAQVYELDVDAGTLFMAMEFVQGCTLVEMARACRQAKEPIPIGFTLASVRDTALALHYAHNFTDPRGRKQVVIHRDVAEKNIMVTYEGTTKLLDFGIAKAMGRSNRTSVGMVKGTSGYMSPEQIRGEPLDGRSDIFSLGVVLHECLTGMRLFFGKSAHEGMLAVLKEDPLPPSKTNSLVTPEIDAVVMKSLFREREGRYATALEFARAIEKAAPPDTIWLPEQTADFVQKHFTQRRIETRNMLEAASYGVETTGEISINKVLEKVRSSASGGTASGEKSPPSSAPRAPEPKRSAAPAPAPTPPIPPPAGVKGPVPKPSTPPVRPSSPTAPTPALRNEPTTAPNKPAVRGGAAAEPPVATSLYDEDDDEHDAKTLPAKALPAELVALRDKLKSSRGGGGGETVPYAAATQARPDLATTPQRPSAAGGVIPRSTTGETLSVTNKGSNPYDEDEVEAKTTVAHPFQSPANTPRPPSSASLAKPSATTDRNAAFELGPVEPPEPEEVAHDTSGTQPTLEPLKPRNLPPKPGAPTTASVSATSKVGSKRNPLLLVALVLIVLLTSLGVLFLLELPPFAKEPRKPAPAPAPAATTKTPEAPKPTPAAKAPEAPAAKPDGEKPSAEQPAPAAP